MGFAGCSVERCMVSSAPLSSSLRRERIICEPTTTTDTTKRTALIQGRQAGRTGGHEGASDRGNSLHSAGLRTSSSRGLVLTLCTYVWRMNHATFIPRAPTAHSPSNHYKVCGVGAVCFGSVSSVHAREKRKSNQTGLVQPVLERSQVLLRLPYSDISWRLLISRDHSALRA
jgi:hypothetical protein